MNRLPAIEVRGLSKSFGGRKVVDQLDIRVERGCIYGFLGPNGSGKTTTIRMLCGLLRPDDGEGQCLGMDIRRDTATIKRRVGYMTQRFGLYEDLTVEENLQFVARAYGIDRREERVRNTLESLGLQTRRGQLAGPLSGGWKQRLALGACMMHEPDLLLLDEPTAGVDPKARRDFWSQIHRLADEGLTVLVSTHYMDEAERCHKLAYISYGRLLASGTADEVIHKSGLRTWSLAGGALMSVRERLENSASWFCAPFGNVLHVSAPMESDLPSWLDRHLPEHGCEVKSIPTGLEDVFIALTKHAEDNFS